MKRERDRPKVVFVNPDKTVVERLKVSGFHNLKQKIILVPKNFGLEETNETIQKMILM